MQHYTAFVCLGTIIGDAQELLMALNSRITLAVDRDQTWLVTWKASTLPTILAWSLQNFCYIYYLKIILIIIYAIYKILYFKNHPESEMKITFYTLNWLLWGTIF